MINFENLDKSTQQIAYKNALAAYFQSAEWTHILETAVQIQQGMISYLQELNLIDLDDPLLDCDYVELELVSDIDMPASVRAACACIEEMINDGYQPDDIVDNASQIFTAIVEYWRKDAQENLIDWIEDQEIYFNDDGGVFCTNQTNLEPGTQVVEVVINGVSKELTVNTFKDIQRAVMAIGAITHLINPDEHNLKISDLVNKLNTYLDDGYIQTEEGNAIVSLKKQINLQDDADITAVGVFAEVIEILAASEEVDNFDSSDEFLNLRARHEEVADILIFLQGLYQNIDLNERGEVTMDHVAWYLNEHNRHHWTMNQSQAEAYALRMFNDGAWDIGYELKADTVRNEHGCTLLDIQMTVSRHSVDDEATHEYANRLDENGQMPEFLAYDDQGEIIINLAFEADIDSTLDEPEVYFDLQRINSATMYDGSLHLENGVERIIECIGESTLCEDALNSLSRDELNTINNMILSR